MNNHLEISDHLISEEEIRQRLGSIFVDSIILKSDYCIETISKNLEQFLEFTGEELQGKQINYLGASIREAVEDGLGKGYFENVALTISTKSRLNLSVTVSGFYLGLISDFNGYIVLTIKFSDDPTLKKELFRKTQELDSFIYRTAHDLRGPLATIKGLVNLLKIRKDNSEVDELIRLVEIHSEKLDDRLQKLVYLADTDTKPYHSKGHLNFQILSGALHEIIAMSYPDINLSIGWASVKSVSGINELLTTALVKDLLFYVISLPRVDESNIDLNFSIANGFLKVTMQAAGFQISEQIRKAIRQSSFIYNDMLSFPFLVNYYAAQKIALQLNTVIKIEFKAIYEQHISVSIPLQNTSEKPVL
ncbi:MAG TPA: histidine kinase dimerization/phospho-acceptor domain-containing protein [Cyclobacteriaceae bacterium]